MPSPINQKRPHIFAIDYVRLFVITSVVAVHIVAQIPTSVGTGAVLMLLHMNRELFILISAFVLTYSYGRRQNLDWPQFFRRRYLLAGVPYVVWTIIYLLAGDHPVFPIGAELSTLGYYLINGGARYHLYFLLILFQLYLIFPLLRRVLARTIGHHWWLLGVSAAGGLVFTFLVQRSVGAYGPLGFWLGYPDPWLLSYQFFIVAGAVAAWHLDALLEFVRRHSKLLVWLALGASGLSLGLYFLQLRLGMSVDSADTTFQPIVLIQTVVVALLLLAAGYRWESRGAQGKRFVVRAAVATFGVFLIHPLIIQLGVSLASALGLVALFSRAPSLVSAVAALLIGLPLVMALSLGAAELFHRTPLSLALAGRPRQRPIRTEKLS